MSGVSPTQRPLESADVERLVAASFGAHERVLDAGPLSGGGFAAVWWITLSDRRTVVLKASPPAHVPLLAYEQGLLSAEARYYRLVGLHAPQVPVPRVVRYGTDPLVLDGDWMFTTLLDGRTLADLSTDDPDIDDAPVRRALGAAVASLHAVIGRRFGYDGGRVAGTSWRTVFGCMVTELLADAKAWGVQLTAPAASIRSLIDRHGDLLDQVDRPALLHFDTWDGNVLAAAGAAGADGALRLTGLIDGERFLYGDPLMDLVSTALYRRIEDEPSHPFLEGYATMRGAALVFDAPARRRLALYRLHLYLLMTVEMPSRGISRNEEPERYERLATLLDEQLTELGRGGLA